MCGTILLVENVQCNHYNTYRLTFVRTNRYSNDLILNTRKNKIIRTGLTGGL